MVTAEYPLWVLRNTNPQLKESTIIVSRVGITTYLVRKIV